jgi:hypothetical protein
MRGLQPFLRWWIWWSRTKWILPYVWLAPSMWFPDQELSSVTSHSLCFLGWSKECSSHFGVLGIALLLFRGNFQFSIHSDWLVSCEYMASTSLLRRIWLPKMISQRFGHHCFSFWEKSCSDWSFSFPPTDYFWVNERVFKPDRPFRMLLLQANSSANNDLWVPSTR